MDKIEPIVRESFETPTPTGEGHSADVDKMRIASYFGLENSSPAEEKTLSELTRLLRTDDPGEMLWALKTLESRIGTPKVGTSRMQHVYNYVKLSSQINSLEQERDSYGPQY